MNHELQISTLRKKHSDVVAELSDQLEQMQKLKVKLDKDKAQMLRDLEEAHSNADAESRQKQELEKHSKLLEMQLSELQTKADEQVMRVEVKCYKCLQCLMFMFVFMFTSEDDWKMIVEDDYN